MWTTKWRWFGKVWLDFQSNFEPSKTWAKNVIYLSNSHIQMRSMFSWNTMENINQLKNHLCAKKIVFVWQFYGNSIEAISSLGSTIVVMKTSFTSSTTLQEPTSFHKTTFQPSFFKFSKKKSYIVWLGNMKGSNIISSLC